MKVYETKSALKVFYYLMAIDGAIGEDEMDRFCEIGEELDRKNFDSYRDELAEECKSHINSAESDDDYYDVIQENADAALRHEAKENDKGLTPRLLIWDLFAVAFSNNEYNASEKKLIAHIARISDVEKSILLEMEQMMQTAISVQREMTWLKQSDKPYSEIRPLIDELENRIQVISGAAKALIEDEGTLDDSYEEKPDFFDKAKNAIDDTMSPAFRTAGDAAKDVGEKVRYVGGAVAGAVCDAWKGLLSKKKKGEQPAEGKKDK